MTAAQADQLHRKFILAAAVDEILPGLNRFYDASEIEGLPPRTILELRYSGLHSLHRLIGGDALVARDIIQERLLPICLGEGDTSEFEQKILFIQSRELAGEWLNDLSGPDAQSTVHAAIAFLVSKLDRPSDWRTACWTISEIGYREKDLTARLWTLFRSEEQEKSDTALATLAALGLSGEERLQCLSATLAAATERLPSTLVNTLLALPDSATIRVLEEAWLDRSETELDSVAQSLFALFSQIGMRLQDADAADAACSAIAKLMARAPTAMSRRVRLTGNALPRLDSPLATKMLVDLLPEETDSTSYDRWLVMLRLQSCCRPRQLGGLEANGSHAPAVLAALSTCVLERGTHLGRDSTLEGQTKIAALETALLLGADQALEWLGPALANEANPYLQREIMETYAALRVSPLPDPIPSWIIDEAHLAQSPADNIELMRRLAASRVARSAATPEAFDLLSKPGLVWGDSVMLETAEGLVAATLFVGADLLRRPRVLEELFTGVEKPTTLPQLSSACRALAAAARQGWLDEPPWGDRLLASGPAWRAGGASAGRNGAFRRVCESAGAETGLGPNRPHSLAVEYRSTWPIGVGPPRCRPALCKGTGLL
jgi:hypothetical protein